MNLRSCKRFMPRTRILDHVQTAVDAQHHLIVAHDVTNVGTTAINSRTWRVRPSPPWASRRSMSRPTATTSRARRFRGRLSLSGRPASDLALHVGGEGNATVEHPFGTLKARIGATHFKTRTLEKVGTEMSLHVLTYNLKRVIAILGAETLMMRA
jgi:hypothetical protein